MADKVRDVMTARPVTVTEGTSVVDAARAMATEDIGDVLVLDRDDRIRGVVTDRDIVVRTLAEDREPSTTPIEQIPSEVLVTVGPDDPVGQAVRLMRERAVRRLPVVEDDRPVGVVSLGDLAIDRDPRSALGEISSAPPNE